MVGAIPGAADARRFIIDNTRPGHHPLVAEVTLRLAEAVTPIWQASEDILVAKGLAPPFWAFAWPGGAALARFILDHPGRVMGRAVFDLAAGSGIAAIAAAKAGAAVVTAAEIDAFACAAIALNAEANGVAVAIGEGDALDDPPPRDALIVAGDVCYERDMARRATAWLAGAVDRGCEVWLADPGRAYLPQQGLVELARMEVPTSLELEDREIRETVIYRLTA